MGAGGLGAESGGWPLVGRDDELTLAADAIARRRGVVLTGPAGVGKTRLARELIALGAGDGDRTEWITATEAAAHIPLGAAAHLVPSATIGRGRDAMLSGIVAALDHGSEGGPLLLGVDDAHLLDDGSAALVHLLATTGTATVVVTVRDGVAAPDAVTSIWKDGPATLIALQSLARNEVDTLVANALQGPLDGSLSQLLWESSSGNALYLRELVRHGLDSGSLRCDRGLWRWHGSQLVGARLQGLVEMRMGSLTVEERAALELVAIGEPLSLQCAHALGVAPVVEHMERRGLVSSLRRQDVEIRLAHPLFGEVLRRQLSESRLDAIRLRLADALEPLSLHNPADEFRVVLWRAEAGDHSRPEQLRAAARTAWVLWAAPVAEQLARAALESGSDLEAGYLLGEALADQGRPIEAVEVWESVELLPGPDRVRAALAHGHSSILHFHLGRSEEAVAVLRRAAARVTDPAARQVIDGALPMFRMTSGRRLGVEVSTVDPATIDAPSASLAATVERISSGHLYAAEQIAGRAIETSGAWGDEFPTMALLLQQARTWARLLAGHVAESQAEADDHYAAAVLERVDYPRATWCLVRGVVAVLRGLPDTAIRTLSEGLALTSGDDSGWRRPMHAYSAMAAAMAGDATSAAEHSRRADDANRSLDGLFAVDVGRADAWACAARGEMTAAIARALAAAEVESANGHRTFEAFALHDVARFGAAVDIADRLVEVAAGVDGTLVAALARHARALADDDACVLDVCAMGFADLGLDLLAAEASTDAARAHRRSGRKAGAHASLECARRLAAGCQSASTPAMTWDGDRVGLTRREREVAELAASGLASRDIAIRLGIATRTVDNLLGRVYVKLGVSGRLSLGELLGERRLRE